MVTNADPKLKIAQVITRMDWGGAPDIVRILCEYLDTSYEVKLIIGPSEHLTEKTGLFLQNFRENIIVVPYLKREINPLWDFLALTKLFLVFKKEKFDIVHTHTAKAGFLGRIASWMAGIHQVIYMPHGHVFYGYFGLLMSKIAINLERFVAYLTSTIMVSTELEKRDLIAFKVTTPEKIIVINSGLELENYKDVVVDVQSKRDKLQIEEDVSVIGMISRLEPVKGPGYLIEAAKIVIEQIPKIKFLIVGDGSLRKDLESQCEDLGILDEFIFTGWKEDVRSILSMLDILVLPSLNEAVGRVLIEAGACGIPVIATNVGGVPEIVRNKQTGILVPPRSPELLAQAIIDLITNEHRRHEMGIAAKGWIDDRFSACRMVERVSKSYKELVESGRN